MHNQLLFPKRVVLCFTILIVLIIPIPHATHPIRAASSGINVDSQALQFTMMLGQNSTQSLKLTNTNPQAVTPALYEAYTAPASTSATHSTHYRVALPKQANRIDPQLTDTFQSNPHANTDFLLYMQDQADLSIAEQINDWKERGRYVYQTLVDHAERSQYDLRDQLRAHGLTFHPLWIVNAVVVHGTQADVQMLAQRQDIALIRANHVNSLPASTNALANARCNPSQPSNAVCWNIGQIGGDRAWRDFGVTGQHIVLANIDTGVRFDHPALSDQYRGRLANGQYDHNYNWFDPAGQYPIPTDTNGHGTHTMGTMVARSNGTVDQPAVGVAPDARWIAARGCSGSVCSDVDLIQSAQWLLAPSNLAGEQPRPDLRPMIINNSWAGDSTSNWYAGYTAAWRAAGIFPVFAAGNGARQVCGSIASPGDYADVTTVGAVDQNQKIAPFSLLGPSSDGRRKPDFVAPGAYSGSAEAILSTALGDAANYKALQGTSMAAPHVAGVVALIWSANPALIGNYDATYAIIRDTAHLKSDTRCGDAASTANNVYGSGEIDAYAAVARARVDIPWLSSTSPNALASGSSATVNVTADAARVPGPGVYAARLQVFGEDITDTPSTIAVTLTVLPASSQATITGRVVSATTGAPIAATVGVENGLGVASSSSGVYTLTLATGSYDLVATAPAFFPSTRHVTLSGNQVLPDIVMQPNQPQITLATTSISRSVSLNAPQPFRVEIQNSGTQTLYYHVRVLPDQFAIRRSDQPDGPSYTWIDLPPNAARLNLASKSYSDMVPLGIPFPFFNYTFTETTVTKDGTLAFSPPNQTYTGPRSRCLPASEFYFYLIAPFRSNLAMTSNSAIRYATIANGTTFVLSYENMIVSDHPNGDTYTFQVLLHNDGRIIFQYRALGVLFDQTSVGVQYASSNYQEVGCGSTLPITNGMAIEFRPQVRATHWLQLATDEGHVLPHEQQEITGTLAWSRPPIWSPQLGRIEISSNDLIHPSVVVSVTLDMLAPPYEAWLPILRAWR